MANKSFSISEVERQTGIAKETLRVWERRYEFPRPGRDAHGERIYPEPQLQKLHQLKRLLDLGYRPGKIIHLAPDQLAELAAQSAPSHSGSTGDPEELAACIALVKQHDIGALRQRLSQQAAKLGMRNFVTELAAPLTRRVGIEWAGGTLAVFEEHLYAEALHGMLRSFIHALAQQKDSAEGAPRVLLTTLPLERHGLGLLMAEALLVLEGAHCISLGLQTPLNEIIDAAARQDVDVVALSFASSASQRSTVDNLNELSARLPDGLALWAGGDGAAAARRHIDKATVMTLENIGDAVAAWRAVREEAEA
jgi:DNA-binding transcriptional MerR regulator